MTSEITVIYDSKGVVQDSALSTLNLESLENLILEIKENQVELYKNERDKEIIIACKNYLKKLIDAQESLRKSLEIDQKLRYVRHKYNFSNKELKSDKIMSMVKIEENNISETYAELRQERRRLLDDNKVQSLLVEADNFNEKIIKIINENAKLKTVVVIPTVKQGTVQVAEITDMEKLIKAEGLRMDINSEGQLQGRFTISQQKYRTYVEQGILKELNKEINQTKERALFLKNLDKVYFEARHRMLKAGKGSYLIWSINKKWSHKIKVPGKEGDLNEAYMWFKEMYNGSYNIFNGSNMEKNIQNFVYGSSRTSQVPTKGLFSVDSLSGLYKGDISKLDENIELAIKSGNASFLGLVQIRELTEKILTNAVKGINVENTIKEAYKKNKDDNKGKERFKIIKEEIKNRASEAIVEAIENSIK